MTKKLYNKILLLFLIPVLGMLYYSGIYLYQKYYTLKSMNHITSTIKYIQHAENLLNNIQKERGLSAGFIGSVGVKFKNQLHQQRKDTNYSYIKFKTFILNNETKNIKHQFNIKQIQQKYHKIQNFRSDIDKFKITYSKSFKNYTSINTSIIDSISYLISFSHTDNISTNLSSLLNIIKTKEYAGQERAILSNLFTTCLFCSSNTYEYLIKVIALQDTNIEEFLLKSDLKELNTFQTKLTQDMNNEVQSYRNLVINSQKKQNIKTDSLKWWVVSTNRVNSLGDIAYDIMENILYKVKNIKNNAFVGVIFSFLFWIIGFVALTAVLYYLKKIVNQEKLNFELLIKQKHIYNILSQTNELIIHDYTQDELSKEICNMCTKESNLSLAFIGMLDKDENINITASSGSAKDYLSKLTLSANPHNSDKSLGLAGKAIFENRNIIIDDVIGDGSSLFFEVAKNYDLHSAAAYPIRKFNKIVGVIVFYAKDINFFDKDIVLLFDRMASDISFGLEKIHHEKLRKKEELQLIHQAYHDGLTDLPNRLLFQERLNYSIQSKNRTTLKGAVLFIDLDNFKPVNDNYGHHVGDLLLNKIAKILISNMREEDTVARFGGDEFVILIDHLDSKDIDEIKSNLTTIAQKIRIEIEQTHILDEKDINITASIGITIFPNYDLKKPDDIIKTADKAMYKSKSQGKNQIQFI